MEDYPVNVVGGHLGLAFPTSIDALLAAGAPFLTRAFHATGALPRDNAVARIETSREFFGGGMGRKLLMEVTYARPDPALHTRLFAKFPRDFGDPLRPLFAPLMEPEVRFALLSREADFPITVPRCYFADYDPQTASGLLITERVAYGTGAIEPAHDKCLDYRLADPLPHYEALTIAMARLAAFHRSGRFPRDIDARFPFDPDAVETGARIPHTAEQLDEKLMALQSFAAAAPQLFEPALLLDGFLERFCAEAPLVLRHEETIRSHLNHADECVALCHWNMNIDNAWFWRDESGILQAGLLDWGSVGQMNLAQAFYGMTCAAETRFLDAHRAHLMRRLLDDHTAGGGPVIDPEAFAVMVTLAVAVLGIAWILDAPAIVAREVPGYAALADRRDPGIRDNFLARAQLQLLNVFLNEWRACDPATAIRRLAATRVTDHGLERSS